jgi:hypothetical protein
MWRKIGRDDFLGSAPALDRDLRHPFVWPVYNHYEATEGGQEPQYLWATEAGADDLRKAYEPLQDTPHLFLEFARLGESKDRGGALEEWISSYGLLGLHRNRRRRFREGLPEVESSAYRKPRDVESEVIPAVEYSSRGGHGETLDSVWREVSRASSALTCYEAALSKEEDRLEAALTKDSPDSLEDLRSYCKALMELETGGSRVDVLVHLATHQVFWAIQEVLEHFTYPCMSVDIEPDLAGGPESLHTPDHFYRSWHPRNLLGALYLQAYWLVTSASELSRCRHCSRVITYTAAFPGAGSKAGRKQRSDKEFCNSRCRQNYHYHHRVKP